MHWLFDTGLNELSEFKDPFKKECIQTVTMAINKDLSGNFQCSGRVHYANGNTGGYQEFNAKDFKSLLAMMQTFIDSKI